MNLKLIAYLIVKGFVVIEFGKKKNEKEKKKNNTCMSFTVVSVLSTIELQHHCICVTEKSG